MPARFHAEGKTQKLGNPPKVSPSLKFESQGHENKVEPGKVIDIVVVRSPFERPVAQAEGPAVGEIMIDFQRQVEGPPGPGALYHVLPVHGMPARGTRRARKVPKSSESRLSSRLGLWYWSGCQCRRSLRELMAKSPTGTSYSSTSF
jgi:hypothetical protein